MYEFLSQLAQTVGLVLFVVAFGLVLIYALAPGNRRKFDRAAHMPLTEGDEEDD